MKRMLRRLIIRGIFQNGKSFSYQCCSRRGTESTFHLQKCSFHHRSPTLAEDKTNVEALRKWREEASKKASDDEKSSSAKKDEGHASIAGEVDEAAEAAAKAWEASGYVEYMDNQRTKGWKT